MSIVNLRLLPKHTFTSIIFPFLKTVNDDIGILETNIKIGQCNFEIKNNIIYDYKISEFNKTTRILTKISTNIDKINFNIYEQITVKREKNNINTYNYTNYSVNIVNSKDHPFIHSIKCIQQPISFDLMNFYTNDIKEFYEIINKNMPIKGQHKLKQ
jgi:hypothetical protein